MDADKGPQIRAASYSMLLLPTIAVCLRFWSRRVAKDAGFWWDDWTALIALPFVWGLSGLIIYWAHIGLGKHQQTSTSSTADAKVMFAVNILYNTSLSLVKLSVLLFYARVFKIVRAYLVAFWLTGFLIVGWFITFNFLAIFTCVPVQKKWHPDLKGYCLSQRETFIGAAAPNILIDVILLLLPVGMVWRLQISLKQKLALILVFLAGYCVIIMSILRVVSSLEQSDSMDEDFTWNFTKAAILVVCETPVALISACLPSIFNLAKNKKLVVGSWLNGRGERSQPCSTPETPPPPNNDHHSGKATPSGPGDLVANIYEKGMLVLSKELDDSSSSSLEMGMGPHKGLDNDARVFDAQIQAFDPDPKSNRVFIHENINIDSDRLEKIPV